jgi:acetyl esterase/lipase
MHAVRELRIGQIPARLYRPVDTRPPLVVYLHGGGTLAALACLRLRDEHPAALPGLQVLLYANTDLTGAEPSMREKAAGWGLNADTVRFFNSQWVPDRTRWSDPGVSPLHAPDLSGLPSALIVTAEHDPYETSRRPTHAACATRASRSNCAVSPA